MTDSKSECFDELKALKTWLGVKVNCKSTDIDTLEAHCFKYARSNREAIAEGWTVKPISVYQFINFCFKELNFGESKTECALGYAKTLSNRRFLMTPLKHIRNLQTHRLISQPSQK